MMLKSCSYAFSGCQMPAVGAWWWVGDEAGAEALATGEATWMSRPLWRCWEHRHLPPARWEGKGFEWQQVFQPGQRLAVLDV